MEMTWYNRTLTDIRLVVTPGDIYNPYQYGTPEYFQYLEDDLKRIVADFREFLRDHRSQDWLDLSTEHTYSCRCRHCGWDYGNMDHPERVKPDCCDEALLESGQITAKEYLKYHNGLPDWFEVNK